MILSKTYDILYDIIFFHIIVIYPFLALFFVILPTLSYTYHTESALISELHDIKHDFAYDMAL
jgi:hypothetical protein